MKHLLFLITLLGAVVVSAASSYTCTVEGTTDVFTMTPVAGGMEVAVQDQKEICKLEESSEVLLQINEGLKNNLGVIFDAEVLVVCEGQVADGTLVYMVSKSGVNNMPMNNIISNPVIGPINGATCIKN
ncbi:MAG: hypothetical protein IT287_05325 [Bdellovibrionaceae bacterium]|nr:hypothetical protein [Pseudobdellovibrionaceae bacterium]